MRKPGAVELLVVLAQEVLAVVVAIRAAHHRVHVIVRGLGTRQRNAALMIELDQDHRTVDAIRQAGARETTHRHAKS